MHMSSSPAFTLDRRLSQHTLAGRLDILRFLPHSSIDPGSSPW